MSAVNEEPSEEVESGEDWMQVTLLAPADVGCAVREFLREKFGFVDIAPIDWCVLERRQDFSRVTYAPVAPLTRNLYSANWRETRQPLGFDVDPGGKH